MIILYASKVRSCFIYGVIDVFASLLSSGLVWDFVLVWMEVVCGQLELVKGEQSRCISIGGWEFLWL